VVGLLAEALGKHAHDVGSGVAAVGRRSAEVAGRDGVIRLGGTPSMSL